MRSEFGLRCQGHAMHCQMATGENGPVAVAKACLKEVRLRHLRA